MRNKHKHFTLPQKLIAGIIASSMFATGIGMAFAADDTNPDGTGGGGSGTGSGGTGGSSYVKWIYQESFGAPNVENAKNALRQAAPGIWIGPAGSDDPDRAINDAVSRANNECVARGGAPCRLVGLGFVISTTPSLSFTGASGNHTENDWRSPWAQNIQPNPYYRNGVAYRTNDIFNDGSNSVDSLMFRETTAPQSKSVIALVLGANEPVPQDYNLSVTTTQQAPKTLTIGDSTPVRDMIHASANGSQIRERITAKVILHADLPRDSYVPPANPVSKTVTIANQGDTASPEFSPADFGWDFWPEGSYWFDVQVAKQGKMSQAVDTADREVSETFKLASTPPAPPRKTVSKGVSADSMVNTTRIVSGTGVGGFEMRFTDTISANGVAYTVTNMRVTDLTASQDVSDQFAMNWNQQDNTVTAIRSADHGLMPAHHDFEFSFDVTVSQPTDYKAVQDTGTVAWNHNPAVSTNPGEFPTWQPKPDKSWVRWDNKTKQWQTVIDPDRTNTTGADTMVFLDGDKVGAVVNGTLPARLAQAPERIVF